MNIEQMKARMNHTFSKVAGVPTDVTVRGDRDFTFMFEGEDFSAAKRILDFFGREATCVSNVEYDDECAATFLFVNNVSLIGARK